MSQWRKKLSEPRSKGHKKMWKFYLLLSYVSIFNMNPTPNQLFEFKLWSTNSMYMIDYTYRLLFFIIIIVAIVIYLLFLLNYYLGGFYVFRLTINFILYNLGLVILVLNRRSKVALFTLSENARHSKMKQFIQIGSSCVTLFSSWSDYFNFLTFN